MDIVLSNKHAFHFLVHGNSGSKHLPISQLEGMELPMCTCVAGLCQLGLRTYNKVMSSQSEQYCPETKGAGMVADGKKEQK